MNNYFKHTGLEGAEGRANVTSVTPLKKNADPVTHSVVGGAHAFILRISSFFGLAPLQFESRETGFTVSISSTMCIYSFVLVTVLIISTVYGLFTEITIGIERSVRMSSRMSQVVSTCDVLMVVVTAGVGVYGAPARMRKMLKFMDKVALVDLSIGGQYSPLTERKLCAILFAILLFFTLLIVDDFSFYALQARDIDRHWEIVVNYIGFYLLWYVVMILELQFAFTALSIHARFRALNDTLALSARDINIPLEKTRKPTPLNVFAIRVTTAETRRIEDVSLLVEVPKRSHPVIVRKSVSGEPVLAVPACEAILSLASLHGNLCEIIQQVDNSYGIPLVAILLSTLLHLIVTPYFLIMEILTSSTRRVHFLVLQFLWCAIHMLRMFIVVEPSHYTIIQGKRTENLVCRLISAAPTSGVLPARLELFSRQLLLRSMSYAPMGMCVLDRPLVASILGAVTTYLVIVIQFQRYDV